MANPIEDNNLKQALDMYKKGVLYRFARENIIRGYNLAGLFPFEAVKTKKIEVVEEIELPDLTDPRTGKPDKKAKGSDVREIRGITTDTNNVKLNSRELKIRIQNEDLENPTSDILSIIQSMTYHIGLGIENDVTDTIKNNATLVPANALGHDWTNKEYRDISRDILKFRKTNLNESYVSDMVAMGDLAKTELASVLTGESGNYTSDSTNFTIEGVRKINNVNCFYGGVGLGDGELLGFNSVEYPVKIFFKEYNNPFVKKAPVASGLEKVAPPINILMYDDSETESEPSTTIKVATAYKPVPMKQGKKAILYKDVLA